ncbi:hypothetical protein [Mycobacterium lepromatosis]|uniref:hypothetical protein n=1 Tax=Mycobacterium lepromatosis TaxID=480418 RepID=UPI0006789274
MKLFTAGLADKIIDTLLRSDIVILNEISFTLFDDTGHLTTFSLGSRQLHVSLIGDRLTSALRAMGTVPA